jgi:hypothetical protein
MIFVADFVSQMGSFFVLQYIMIATEDASSFCILAKTLVFGLVFYSLELIHVGHVSTECKFLFSNG